MELTGVTHLEEALEAEREARRQAERELDRLRGASADADAALQRSRFLVSMGHTLRTPLNAILGFSEVLQQGACGQLTEGQLKFVGRIANAGQRQLGLINNLIDLARIHAGEMIPEPQSVNAMQLVQAVVNEYAAAAKERGIELSAHAESPGLLECDPEQLRQVLASLVDNAIRFTDSGGSVRVTASKGTLSSSVAETSDEFDSVLRIEVADTGNGIPPDDQPLLFDDFEHAESLTSRRQRRSGVGLALARRIVELHGGRIWVESSGVKGEGSHFFIEFPCRANMRSTA
jgi:signal transduction histidine kinase